MSLAFRKTRLLSLILQLLVVLTDAHARNRHEADQVDMLPPANTKQSTTSGQTSTDNRQDSAIKVTKSKKSKKSSGHLWEYKTRHFNMYSIKQEIDIGTHYMQAQIKYFQKKGWKVDPPEYAATKKRIENIVKKIAVVSDLSMLPFEVHIFDKPDIVNAYCLPGGKIGVFTGIFNKEKGLVNEKSDDEIAAVIGHEIAHATMRHVTRRLTTYNSIGFVGNLVSLGVSRSAGGNWASLTDSLFDVGTMLYMPGYSRKYESEADQVGFYYMVKAGYDPQAAITIWERAAERNQQKGKKDKTSFFDSHPASGERANELRDWLPDVAVIKQRNTMINEMKKD